MGFVGPNAMWELRKALHMVRGAVIGAWGGNEQAVQEIQNTLLPYAALFHNEEIDEEEEYNSAEELELVRQRREELENE